MTYEKTLYFSNQAKSDLQVSRKFYEIYRISKKERVENGKISANTISNYYKATRLLCEL
jgi:hypothetical protein